MSAILSRGHLFGFGQDEAAEAANLAALQADVVAGRPKADHAAVAAALHRAQRQALQAHPAAPSTPLSQIGSTLTPGRCGATPAQS